MLIKKLNIEWLKCMTKIMKDDLEQEYFELQDQMFEIEFLMSDEEIDFHEELFENSDLYIV